MCNDVTTIAVRYAGMLKPASIVCLVILEEF